MIQNAKTRLKTNEFDLHVLINCMPALNGHHAIVGDKCTKEVNFFDARRYDLKERL